MNTQTGALLSKMFPRKLLTYQFSRAVSPLLHLVRRDTTGLIERSLHVSAVTYGNTTSGHTAASSDISIQGIEKGHDRLLKLVWNDGSESHFPYVYLRENCKCPECFQSSSQQRIVDVLKHEMLHINAEEAAISEDGAGLHCVWPNGHRSTYPASWLHARRMMVDKEKSHKIVHDDLVVWDKQQMQGKIPCYDFEAVMNDDKTLFDALYSFYQHGLMLVDNGPAREGVWKEMGARIGYVRPTHYGEYFDVKTKGDPNNIAYSIETIPFHVDLLYLTRAPEIQTLHCVEQARDGKGGDNVFVDAFQVAKQLQEINRPAFETLSSVIVPFQDVGTDIFGEFSLGFLRPIIQLNMHGRMVGINVNNFTRRDSFKNLTPKEALQFYDAFEELYSRLYQPENMISHRLQPGQMVFFHNTRVLHSRTAVAPGESRLLQGNYYCWDVIFSKIRCIHARLSLKTPRLYGHANEFF